MELRDLPSIHIHPGSVCPQNSQGGFWQSRLPVLAVVRQVEPGEMRNHRNLVVVDIFSGETKLYQLYWDIDIYLIFKGKLNYTNYTEILTYIEILTMMDMNGESLSRVNLLNTPPQRLWILWSLFCGWNHIFGTIQWLLQPCQNLQPKSMAPSKYLKINRSWNMNHQSTVIHRLWIWNEWGMRIPLMG